MQWCAAALAAEEFTGKCVGITDGDTNSVRRDGRAAKIRLWGIDCPESGKAFGTSQRSDSPCEPGGPAQ